jgi:hypothetical protein
LATGPTDFTLQAERLLRDPSAFHWGTVVLLGLVLYVYAVEIERRRFDVVLAGLALFLMDVFNELVNSAVLGVTGRAAIWTVTGETSYLILIGWTVELALFFLVLGPVFVKSLPPDPGARLLGLPNRVVYVIGASCISVAVEVVLTAIGAFHWEYWWWNVPFVPLIVLFGYATFYGIAAWVFDMGQDRRRQLRVLGVLAAVDLALALAFGFAGWL